MNRHVRPVEEREQIDLGGITADVKTNNVIVALELVDLIQQDDPMLGTVDVVAGRVKSWDRRSSGFLPTYPL